MNILLLKQVPHTHPRKPHAGVFVASVRVPFVPHIHDGLAVELARTGVKGPAHLVLMGVTWVRARVQAVRRFVT